MKRLFALFALSFCLLATASSARGTRKLSSTDLRALVTAMTGEYSSAAQAATNADFSDVTLRMIPVFQKRKDGSWLYVEQAVSTDQTQPFRQRVYHLYLADDSTVAMQVFDIRDPQRFAGAWSDIRRRAALTLYDLVNRPGCVVHLRKEADGTWTGGTTGKTCISSVEGSSYATSEVVIQPEKLVTWDRGWSATGEQVWGAEKGGYELVKTAKLD